MYLRQATNVLTMSQVSQQVLLPWPTSPHCRHQELFGWQLGRVCAALQKAVLGPKDQLDSAHIIRSVCKARADTILGQGETVKHINITRTLKHTVAQVSANRRATSSPPHGRRYHHDQVASLRVDGYCVDQLFLPSQPTSASADLVTTRTQCQAGPVLT
jgi:hypothetical protein